MFANLVGCVFVKWQHLNTVTVDRSTVIVVPFGMRQEHKATFVLPPAAFVCTALCPYCGTSLLL